MLRRNSGVSHFWQLDFTTRKQRHTEGKNRRYVVGITVFRRHTDETIPRKKLLRNSLFLGNPSEISDGIPRKLISEETPKTTSSSEKSSEYTEGRLPRNISMDFPMVQSSEVPTKRSSEFSSGISEERGRRKIPRNLALGKYRGTVPRYIPTTYSKEMFVGNFRGCISSEFRKKLIFKFFFFKLKFLKFKFENIKLKLKTY